jgi:hemerythrin-like metal-binding protein
MAFMDWKNDYSVGIREMDQQHRKLLEIINHLHDAMKSGNDRAQLLSVMNELIDYTRFHFTFEEQMMERVGFPEEEEHKRRHEAMVQRVGQYRTEAMAPGATFSLKLMDFLKFWLTKHILETDMAYARFIAGQATAAGVGPSRQAV